MDNKQDDKNKKNKTIMNWVVIGVLALIVMLFFQYLSAQLRESRRQEITYNQFLNWIETDQVREVLVKNDGTIEITRKDEDPMLGLTYYTGAMTDLNLTDRLTDAGIDFKREIQQSSSTLMTILLYYILPLVIIYVVMMFVFRAMSKGGGVMGVGKSTAKVYVQKQTGVTFKDVAGQEESKESLREIVDFLHNPEKYTSIGAKLPKGALLVGPPGTGKTLLAKAVAGEANVPFYSLSGSDFVEMFVGVGASRVRDLFKQAQQSAPCIIFIDELDAIGKSRDSRYGGNDEREQTLNQLLAEMDGFDTSKAVIILAATNRPEILDKALLRPGRFDRRIVVEKPDLKGRIDTLKVHAKNVRMDETVDFHEIALATSGAVGSDLANIINEAALNAVKHHRQAVSQADLFESVEVVIAGKEKKDRVLSEKERRIVSYHEVGHALCAALQKNTEPVQKITIVPRTMGALGYTMQVPEEEKYLMSKQEIEEELVVLFGGRAAEDVRFDSVTTGASNDIERATSLARAMVTQYGMSERFGLMGLESIENRYLDGRAVLNCGDATAGQIDEEVMKILKVAYDKAVALLRENLEALDKISAYLIENETITGKEFMHIFNQVRGLPDEETPEAETTGTAKSASASNGADTVGHSPTPETAPAGEKAPYGQAGTAQEKLTEPQSRGDGRREDDGRKEGRGGNPLFRVSMPDELGPGNGYRRPVQPLTEDNVWPPVKKPGREQAPDQGDTGFGAGSLDSDPSGKDSTDSDKKDGDPGSSFISPGNIKD